MQPIIAESAYRHGVTDEDMLHAFNNPTGSFDLDEGFVMLVGGDTAGLPIEIGVVVGDLGPVIVHAMRPARRRYLR